MTIVEENTCFLCKAYCVSIFCGKLVVEKQDGVSVIRYSAVRVNMIGR